MAVVLSTEERTEIERLSKSGTAEARMVQRAKIILECAGGDTIEHIAKRLHLVQSTIIKWRNRFNIDRLAGLQDKPRSGKPATYGQDFRNRVLKTIELPAPKGQSSWDGASIAKELNVTSDAVWRVLRKEGICLARQRSWCVSTDPEFSQKAADIVGLYLAPPVNALVISVDEKPSIQALERARGYVCTGNKKIVQGLKSTYKRHGTLNLFAALNVATGNIHTKTTEQKRRVEFLAFMDQVLSELQAGLQKEIHVVLDNYCIHKKNDEWLKLHPNVTFHYTPTSASWLNQVEIWFGILSRKALKNASFRNIDELKKAIEEFVEAYKINAKPFVWRKREVKGSQLRNTIVNLCN